MSDQLGLRAASRVFIAAAFDRLSDDHVIPTPVFHRFIAVGREYAGPSIMELAEYPALEAELEGAYHDRFGEHRALHHREFASTYIFSYLLPPDKRPGMRTAAPRVKERGRLGDRVGPDG